MNFSVGCVVETNLRFHAAVAASNFPARSPTRGSGIGSPGDMLLLLLTAVDIAGAHAATETRPSASDSDNSLAVIDWIAVRPG